MKFYHQGNKKKSNQPGVASGCLMFFLLGAIVYMISLLDNLEDVKEYWFQIVLAFVAAASVIGPLFSKRAKLFNYHISIQNNFFKIAKVHIPVDNLLLDIYTKNNVFVRYHLRDKEGKIAIFSTIQDDLLAHIKENIPEQTHFFEETSHKYDGPYVSIISNQQNLFYNLNTGKFTINSGKQNEISNTPDVYAYDPKYKLGIPLGSKISKK